MILALRTLNGVNINEYKNKFDVNPLELYNEKIEKLIKLELVKIENENIKLTDKGLDFANIVWEEFV